MFIHTYVTHVSVRAMIGLVFRVEVAAPFFAPWQLQDSTVHCVRMDADDSELISYSQVLIKCLTRTRQK